MGRLSLKIALGSLAVLVAAIIPTQSAHSRETSAPSGPKVEIVKPVYDFGTVMEGEHVTHSFTIRNVGAQDLILSGVKTSCGCTAAAPSNSRIAPGGESHIAVTFDTHFQKGHRERTITAYTNDPSTPAAVMTLQGEVKVEVDATPSEVAFGKVRYGTEETREVTISDLARNAKGFKVGPVSNTSPNIKVTQEPRKDGKPGAILTVALLKTMPIGPFDDSIEVVNNRKPIEVHVFGMVTGDLTLDPGQVSFGIVPSKQSVIRILRLTNASPRAVNVLGVSSTNQSVVATVEPVKPGKEYKITVELRKNTPDGQLRGTLAIRTDDARQSTLTVPFYGIIGSFQG
jgi:predicted RNA-binding protein with TRAM domain